MLIKAETIEKNTVQLEISVDAKVFNEALEKSFKKNAKKFSVPGFRKGKAPMHIVEKFYGEQALYEDAIEMVCPPAYQEAIAEKKLRPIDKPDIDIIEIGKNKNLLFSARVTVAPEVDVKDYKGIEIKKEEPVVTDEEVMKVIQAEAERNARIITIDDRPVQSGDTVVIDFEGTIDGESFEGGSAKGYNLVIGSGSFIPGFEDQLIGANTGDEVTVNVTFPDDYIKENLRGKPAVFKVKINEIKLKQIPELDDEFARDVSVFDTFEDYKANIRDNLLDEAEDRLKQKYREAVLNKLVESTEIDIPEIMIRRRVDEIVYDFAIRLKYQGFDLEQYFKVTGSDINKLREEFRAQAEKDVKMRLIVEKIAEIEDITITEDEANAEFKRLAEAYKQDQSEFIKQLKPEEVQYIHNSLISRKTIDFLVDNAKFVD